MKALLIIGHGSPRADANQDVIRLAEVVRSRARFDRVEIGYLDCNEPDIATAVDTCAAAGAASIVVVPYFLHSGKHFLIDVPSILRLAAQRHPGVIITMGDYVGREPQIADVLRDRVAQARER